LPSVDHLRPIRCRCEFARHTVFAVLRSRYSVLKFFKSDSHLYIIYKCCTCTPSSECVRAPAVRLFVLRARVLALKSCRYCLYYSFYYFISIECAWVRLFGARRRISLFSPFCCCGFDRNSVPKLRCRRSVGATPIRGKSLGKFPLVHTSSDAESVCPNRIVRVALYCPSNVHGTISWARIDRPSGERRRR